MQLKRYKEFNEGSKIKNALKSEFQIGVDHIRNILKENPLVSDLKEIPKSGKDFIWKFKLKEEFPFEIELKLPFKNFIIYFTHIESINRYGDNAFETLERLVEDSGYYINNIISKYTKFEEEKRDFELDYPIEDIKNWTNDIKDFDDIGDFKIESLNYGDDRPNSKSLNWVLGWQSKPGYLLGFILNKPLYQKIYNQEVRLVCGRDSDEINKVLDELGKRLENNGLKMESNSKIGWHLTETLPVQILRQYNLYRILINKI